MSTRTRENAEYAEMLTRMVRAYGKRLSDADPYDLREALDVLDELDASIRRAVLQQQATHGFSWAQIGDALGISRQGAFQRFGRPKG